MRSWNAWKQGSGVVNYLLVLVSKTHAKSLDLKLISVLYILHYPSYLLKLIITFLNIPQQPCFTAAVTCRAPHINDSSFSNVNRSYAFGSVIEVQR